MTAHDARPRHSLSGYREVVEEVVARGCRSLGSPDVALDHLDRSFDEPALRDVLDAVPGGRTALLARAHHELRTFRPHPRSNAQTPSVLLKILLLHQIDVMWWSDVAPFAEGTDVAHAIELTSLPALRAAGGLAFRFRAAPRGLSGRVRNYSMHRWAPDLEPRSSGLSHAVARPAIIGLLNDIAGRFADAVPTWRRGLWVNSIVRSVVDQERLRELGYSALLPSSHCTGYAADIEMTWLREHRVAEPLQEILIEMRDAGVVNVIDEGQAWHVCLAPAAAGSYAATVPAQRSTVHR